MLSQFWGDLAACVFLWDICNQPPCKLSQKQTESCSWASTRLSRENIQFSHLLYFTKGGRTSSDSTTTQEENDFNILSCFFGGFCSVVFQQGNFLFLFLILLIFTIIYAFFTTVPNIFLWYVKNIYPKKTKLLLLIIQDRIHLISLLLRKLAGIARDRKKINPSARNGHFLY